MSTFNKIQFFIEIRNIAERFGARVQFAPVKGFATVERPKNGWKDSLDFMEREMWDVVGTWCVKRNADSLTVSYAHYMAASAEEQDNLPWE